MDEKSQPVTCPVCCSSVWARVLTVETTRAFEIVECGGCKLVYATPRPTETELREHYGSDYFTGSSKETGYENYFGVGEDNMRKMWPSFVRYAGLEDSEPGSTLDVGCASGAFLAEAKRAGWRTKGVDLGADAVLRARDTYGLDVDLGDVFSPCLDGKKFDIVTLWHTLEHLIGPMGALRKARELLVPGGRLFVEVPNWGSLGRIIKGNRWAQLLPPAHINYFTPQSIRTAAGRAGFEVLRVSTLGLKGFDRLKADPRLRPFRAAIVGVEDMVGASGHGGYLRLLAGAKG